MVYVRLPVRACFRCPPRSTGNALTFGTLFRSQGAGLAGLRRNPAPTDEHTSVRPSVNPRRNRRSGRDPDHSTVTDLHHFSGQGLGVYQRLGVIDGFPPILTPPCLINRRASEFEPASPSE